VPYERPVNFTRSDSFNTSITGYRANDDDDDDEEKHTLQKQKTSKSLLNTLIRGAKFLNTRSPGQLHFVW